MDHQLTLVLLVFGCFLIDKGFGYSDVVQSPDTYDNAFSQAYECRTQKSQRVLDKLSELESDISELKEDIKEVLDFHAVTTEDLGVLREEITDIRSCFQCDEEFAKAIQWAKNNMKEDLLSKSFKRPSFISDWFEMKSQDESLSEVAIEHGLDVIPVKVDVLVKATDGPNDGWIFHGDSAIQTDDDIEHTYGGVIYLYNETHVRLFAPNKNNGHVTGRIINTGGEDGRREGRNHQTSKTASVKVKVWAPDDMPAPDYESDWLPIDITNAQTSFYEKIHGFSDYPALVNVQVLNEDASLISEGVGSTVGFRDYLNGGGVVWGFNNESVRIWPTYFPEKAPSIKQGYGKPIVNNDGWGKPPHFTHLNLNIAKVRILAWSPQTVKPNQNFFTGKWDVTDYESGPVDIQNEPLDQDLFSIYTEAKSGPNSGYRFQGYGGAHGEANTFGGTVFAYNENGQVRSWPPNPSMDGHLVNIQHPYGNGQYVQSSNDAVYVKTLWKSSQ